MLTLWVLWQFLLLLVSLFRCLHWHCLRNRKCLITVAFDFLEVFWIANYSIYVVIEDVDWVFEHQQVLAIYLESLECGDFDNIVEFGLGGLLIKEILSFKI